MKFKIKHISFLQNDERSIAKCTINGRFLAKSKYFGFTGAKPQSMTAFEFVTLPVIAESDPVVNLSNGDKMRVYLGGDPFYMVAETQSIIEVHDTNVKEYLRSRDEQSKKHDEDDDSGYYCSADIFEDLQGW
tara:strand:+ start:447 stop:842 length:396 start_codon:yes stop_codon:yes gene_type:complete